MIRVIHIRLLSALAPMIIMALCCYSTIQLTNQKEILFDLTNQEMGLAEALQDAARAATEAQSAIAEITQSNSSSTLYSMINVLETTVRILDFDLITIFQKSPEVYKNIAIIQSASNRTNTLSCVDYQTKIFTDDDILMYKFNNLFTLLCIRAIAVPSSYFQNLSAVNTVKVRHLIVKSNDLDKYAVSIQYLILLLTFTLIIYISTIMTRDILKLTP